MSISSIDEILSGASTPTQPKAPEHHFNDEPEKIDEMEPDAPEIDEEPEQDDNPSHEETPDDEGDDDSKEAGSPESEYDDYGNKQEPENEVIRERLARQARKHQAEIDLLRAQLSQQNAPQNVQQAAKDFEYDPNASGDWQQQLASFVKQTVKSMNQEQEQSTRQQEEAQVQHEFESKFRDGMNKFDDFRDVISGLPCEITNPMTLATRAMQDPAAFLYAAAKRHPQDLERISKIRDPYAQMTEIGKLEERMRKNKPTTKSPRPIGRTAEDAPTKAAKKKEDLSGDDLLAKADAKRMSQVKTRHRGSR